MLPFALLLLSCCTLWTLAGLWAVLRATRCRSRSRLRGVPHDCPPVSILKPLCGADPGLEQNLQSLLEQDYPEFEVILGIEDPRDLALRAVRALREKYPRVACRIVLGSRSAALNPKVRNLLGMLAEARHDLLLVSDSNVRAPADYVAELVATWQRTERIGLVTNLFAGTGEGSLGAALEAVQLNGFCAAGAALPTLLGDPVVVGKSMLFSRRVWEKLGGFERVSGVLAEDFVMGKLFQHAGYQVALAPTVLSNHTGSLAVSAFLRRHLRWAALRWRLRPAAAALELVTSPLALLPLALLALGSVGWLWAGALLVLRDVGGWVAVRGWRRAHLPLCLSPLRELCMLGVWLAAPFVRHISWRNCRVRLGAGTLLFPQGLAPVERRLTAETP